MGLKATGFNMDTNNTTSSDILLQTFSLIIGNSNGYNIYTGSSDPTVQVKVDEDVSVTFA